MDKSRQCGGLLLVLLLSVTAQADEVDVPYALTDPALDSGTVEVVSNASTESTLVAFGLTPKVDTRPVAGAATEALLALQATGTQASAKPQSVSGAYRERAAARFLKTLEQEIPAVKSDSSFKGK